jgi:hypothetical protein
MTFDSPGVIDVGPLEPALVFALLVVGALACLSGRALGGLTGRVSSAWVKWLCLGIVSLACGVSMMVVTDAVFLLTYRALHPSDRGWVISIGLVWPLLLLPPFLFLIAAVRAVRRGHTGKLATHVRAAVEQ